MRPENVICQKPIFFCEGKVFRSYQHFFVTLNQIRKKRFKMLKNVLQTCITLTWALKVLLCFDILAPPPLGFSLPETESQKAKARQDLKGLLTRDWNDLRASLHREERRSVCIARFYKKGEQVRVAWPPHYLHSICTMSLWRFYGNILYQKALCSEYW